MSRTSSSPQLGAVVGRALVVRPEQRTSRAEKGRDSEARLAEAVGLARSIALDVADALIAVIEKPRPASLLGRGKVDELAAMVRALEVQVVVIDGALTPVQQRNLERAWQCKVIDRTGLILEIFGERARTMEGRLQVELAALTYARSRLVRSWTHLERQRGGLGFVGGPGETQIEADRRLIGDRITRLRRALDAVRRTRGLHRASRRKVPYPVVAFVGYTNAGKSTLFNQLAGAEVFADNLLFATLDPTMRGVTLPSGRRVILSDTVGFIADLPTDLVAAFRATLEEVLQADVVVHVRDIASPEAESQQRDVERVLEELGVGCGEWAGRPYLQALNKIDLVDGAALERLKARAAREPDLVPLSALTGEGCARLLERLDEVLSAGRDVVDLRVALADGASLAWLYRHGEVLSRADEGEYASLRVGLDPAARARFEKRNGRG